MTAQFDTLYRKCPECDGHRLTEDKDGYTISRCSTCDTAGYLPVEDELFRLIPTGVNVKTHDIYHTECGRLLERIKEEE